MTLLNLNLNLERVNELLERIAVALERMSPVKEIPEGQPEVRVYQRPKSPPIDPGFHQWGPANRRGYRDE
jgi:hypothetical protein